MHMRKFFFVAIVVAGIALLVLGISADKNRASDQGGVEKLSIVTSLFPQYDFARAIAGDKAEVMLLLPPGAESHTFDPKPSDMTKIYDSDLFIYTGKIMEPWADRVIDGMKDGGAGKLTVLDASKGIVLEEGGHDDHDDGDEDHDDHDDGDGHEGHDHEYDPHIWLDPRHAMKMAGNIEEALCLKDPENADYYRANASAYRKELEKLDADITSVVKAGKRDTLVFGGRFAYQYFLKRFDLNFVTAYESCSTEAEPSVRDVARVIDYLRKNDVPCIFHEEFVDPKIARSIADQAGASAELFSTAHNVTKDELERGVTYIDIMRGNLARIEKGLN